MKINVFTIPMIKNLTLTSVVHIFIIKSVIIFCNKTEFSTRVWKK